MFWRTSKPKPVTATINDQAITVEPKETLLQAALRQGIDLPYSCRVGGCATCKCRLLDGKVKELTRADYILSDEELDQGYILACQSVPRSDIRIAVPMADGPAARTISGRVVARELLTHDIVELRVQLDDYTLVNLNARVTLTELGLGPGDLVSVVLQSLLEGIQLDLRTRDPLPARAADPQRWLPGRSGCGICGHRHLEDVVRQPAVVGQGSAIASSALEVALRQIALAKAQEDNLADKLGVGDVMADVSLAFRPLDFIQVNAGINTKMIQRALELLAPTPGQRVLDLFCGLGNFTLPLARTVREVVGVEGEAGLVMRARENAAHNNLPNAQFHAADLGKDLSGHTWMREGFDKLLLDPPRSGAIEVLQQLPLKQFKRIVYVSCHPGSLARDAGYLVNEQGYVLVSAGVMDMFPHTAHVESIALFERR